MSVAASSLLYLEVDVIIYFFVSFNRLDFKKKIVSMYGCGHEVATSMCMYIKNA